MTNKPHKTIKLRFSMMEELLATMPNNQEIYEDYVASKAPKYETVEQECEDFQTQPDADKGMTVFPRDENGNVFLYDYQLKGFFKDAAGVLRKVSGTECSKVKAYKKEIDGLLFPQPRKIVLNLPDGGEIGKCQRPLRASTPMGERIALSVSETVPAGTTFECEIVCLTEAVYKLAVECLNYGELRGLGCWRNSGKGRFTYEVIG